MIDKAELLKILKKDLRNFKSARESARQGLIDLEKIIAQYQIDIIGLENENHPGN